MTHLFIHCPVAKVRWNAFLFRGVCNWFFLWGDGAYSARWWSLFKNGEYVARVGKRWRKLKRRIVYILMGRMGLCSKLRVFWFLLRFVGNWESGILLWVDSLTCFIFLAYRWVGIALQPWCLSINKKKYFDLIGKTRWVEIQVIRSPQTALVYCLSYPCYEQVLLKIESEKENKKKSHNITNHKNKKIKNNNNNWTPNNQISNRRLTSTVRVINLTRQEANWWYSWQEHLLVIF